ncbi:MAG: OmpA family protein [Lentimicrobium sp.]|jgi:outer membrane protein OmpA-like peptidoglycan-associated protein|nr:OmpA family protein [Lentimicrobium sp.]
MIKPRLLFLMFLLMPFMLLAQKQSEGRETKHHLKALQYYKASAFDEALLELEKAIKINPEHIESWLLQGDIYSIRREDSLAINSYSEAISINEGFFPPALYILANLQFNEMCYAESIANYEKYLTYPNVKSAESERAKKNISLALFRIEAMQNPVPFEPVNLGKDVNTAGYEFINYLSADGENLFFTRRTPKGPQKDEEFYFATRYMDTLWGNVKSLGAPVNTPGDEGALCLSPDGQLLFFAACNRPDSYGSCDLYVSTRMGDVWGDPQNLGPMVNSAQWDSQPTFSPDGRTLFFVSNRPGGYGSSDIWFTQKDGKIWTNPQNAGAVINTSEAERGPFIHPDGQTLYFSSKGHPGMGEGDIFMSRLNSEGEWSKPENIGFPVNTKADEVNLVVDLQGRFAYISSSMDGSNGLTDIYSFCLPEHVKPLLVTYLKGMVYDSISEKKLGADFILTDLVSGKEVIKSSSNTTTGEFLVTIPAHRNYALTIEKNGYLFYSAHLFIDQEAGIENPYLRDFLLKPIIKDEVTILRNVFFETDSSRLLPESKAELDKLYNFMVKNHEVSIEISGHTDNTGAIAYNMELSKKRAESVYKYLIDKGINPVKLTFKGYGDSNPVATNMTTEGKAANRRTEFRIVSAR